MKIKSIEFKNLFAFGEELQRIDYEDKGNLVLLQGKSGVGKSGILQLPTLLLYGKLPRIPKTAIANRINKNGYLKGTIESRGIIYEIIRTFSPNSIIITKDGVDVNNFGVKDAQDWIDTEIIEIPYITFANLISISMNKFKSFLTMTPTELKQIVDRVFSLEIINYVYENIRKDIREISQTINGKNSELFSLTNSLDTANNELNKLTEKFKDSVDLQEINTNKALITEYNEKIQKLVDLYKKISSKTQDLNNESIDIKKKIVQNEYDIENVKNKIKLFEKDKCPMCGTSFKGDNFTEIKEKLKVFLKKKEALQQEFTESLNSIQTDSKKLLDYLNKINSESNLMSSEVTRLTNKNILIASSINSTNEFKSINNIIKTTSENISKVKDDLVSLNDEINDRNILLDIYSIDGVKQQVIDSYLPLLNEEIKNGLLLLNFPYQVVFDSKFNPKLFDLGQEIPAETLSDGERTRVDVIILCAMFKLLKRRYPSTNIMFIDELLSFLDPQNIDHMIHYIKNFAIELKLNVYIVTHVEMENEIFDRNIEVYRENGFAKIKDK